MSSTPTTDVSPVDSTQRPGLHWPTLWLLVGAKWLLHWLTFSGYGIFRDELYYLACSRQLDWGYVDHPPLSIALLTVMRLAFGESLWVVRCLPAVAGAATIGLVGDLAARFGGGRFAQLMAMCGALVAPVYLALNHVYSMNSFDILLWTLAVRQLVRIVDAPMDDAGQPRRWIVLGCILGLGLLNKISVLWLGAGLAVGLVMTPARRWLKTPWPWLAGALSMALFSPYLVWQQVHGWPTLEFMARASGDKMVAKSIGTFWSEQLLAMHPLNAVLWLGGWVYLAGSARLRRFRWVPCIFLTVAVILMLNGSSRSSYLSPAYPPLLAAGGVWLEGRLANVRRRGGLVAVWLLLGAALAPLAMPLLPVDTYIAYSRALGVAPSTSERKELADLPQFYADMHGWQDITKAVAEVFHGLTPQEQASTAIVATNYGVAGAIDYFGPDLGLPSAWSQHNNYYFWGPDGSEPAPQVVLYLGGTAQDLGEIFDHVELAATIDCGHCMPYENQRPIFVCRGLRPALDETWAEGRHFD